MRRGYWERFPGTELTRESVERSRPPGGGGRPRAKEGGVHRPIRRRGRARLPLPSQLPGGRRAVESWEPRRLARRRAARRRRRRQRRRQRRRRRRGQRTRCGAAGSERPPGHGPGAPPALSHTPPGPRALGCPGGGCVRTKAAASLPVRPLQGFGFGACPHLILSPQFFASSKRFRESNELPREETRCLLLRRTQHSA